MARVLRTIVACGLACAAGCAGAEHGATSSASSAAARFDFEKGAPGSTPVGFSSARTGEGPPGKWVLVDGDGAHGRVLAQTDADATDARYPLCVAEDVVARDVRAGVHFQARSGEVDQAAGVVVRCRDANTYYVARANALESNVRFYSVVDGVRKQLASARVNVTGRTWHELVLEARGSRFRVDYDGATLLDVEDATIPGAGKAGLWTKADSVTWFDDFAIEPLDAGS